MEESRMNYRRFLSSFFAIYVVLVLQNIVTISVNLADNVMLGGYSETALSGVAVVNQIQFIYQQLLTALGDGLVIFCSQYWGKGQTGPMKKISATAMHAGLLIAVILFAAVSLFPYNPERADSIWFYCNRTSGTAAPKSISPDNAPPDICTIPSPSR